MILSIKPSLTGAPDTTSREFSTKSGYKAALSMQSEPIFPPHTDQSFNWKKHVWNLNTAPKVKLLYGKHSMKPFQKEKN